MKKKIAILGSTGSIGTQTLDVVRHHPDRFAVVALTANRNVDLLVEQALAFRPKFVALPTEQLAEQARRRLPGDIRVMGGEGALEEAAAGQEADLVISAIVGIAGLKPTLAAIRAGIPVGLAN